MNVFEVDVDLIQSNLEGVAGEVESQTAETTAGVDSLASRMTSLEAHGPEGAKLASTGLQPSTRMCRTKSKNLKHRLPR